MHCNVYLVSNAASFCKELYFFTFTFSSALALKQEEGKYWELLDLKLR